MTDLSPAAQAVSAAAEKAQTHYWELLENGPETDQTEADTIAAAALRAAVEMCAGLPDGRDCTLLLRNIAIELENSNVQ